MIDFAIVERMKDIKPLSDELMKDDSGFGFSAAFFLLPFLLYHF